MKRRPKNTLAVSKKWRLLERIDAWPAGHLLVFIIKQAWAALFGILMVGAIIFTSVVPLPWLTRYDWLFVIAVAIQLIMLGTKLERPREVITIFVFHITGLAMELFKTSGAIGSWTYPDSSTIRIATVPLFSGFMYAAVGSYIARAWRVLDLDFIQYPKRLYTVIFAVAIYLNFFTHHFMYDLRYILFIVLVLLYRRTWVTYRLNRRLHRMPLVAGFTLIALFIWIAENIATFFAIWLYPNQTDHWQMVSISKFGSWLLLMVISFIMIDILHWFYTAKRPATQKKS